MIILRTKDGAQIGITEEQRDAIKRLMAEGADWLDINGNDISASSISGFYLESAFAHRKEKVGRLRDGTRVIREFGVWKDADNPSLHLSGAHYPEISQDAVLPESSYKALIAEGMTADAISENYDSIVEQEKTRAEAPQAKIAGGSKKAIPAGRKRK